MKKILFVCTGNTCRSPMAEGLFRQFLEKRGIKGVSVQSAGLAAFAGDEVSENAVRAAGEYGVDISSHRARRFSDYDAEKADLIVCMTASHCRFLQSLVPEEKLFLPKKEISDPFGGSLEDYKKSAEMIMNSFEDILNTLQGISIVTLDREYIDAVVEVEKECFSSPWQRLAFVSELEKENLLFFLALIEGELAGYVAADNIHGEVYISNVAVASSFRRRGVASALLRHLINISREQNAKFITLEVRQSNKAAISLYEAFGFSKVGERKNYYTKPVENADIMTLFLKKDRGQENENLSN